MPRQNLGELEQVLLLALLRLGGDSYGAAIRAEILATTGRSITPGAIYPTLDRLESRGLLTSHLGEPTAARGGRARREFRLTAAGLRDVRRAWRHTAALAAGIAALKGERVRGRDV
jgi:DNA-binding PadR family transcriptional regulator